MPLTVPKAGLTAGRAAAVRVGTPETGAVISEFGQRMVEVGTQWRDARLQIEGQRAQIGILGDMGRARLELEQVTDPAAIGPAWDQQVAAIREKYLPVDAAGNPTIDPKLAEQIALSIDEMSQKHGLALAGRVIDLTQSQRDAAWIGLRADIVTGATTADPTTFGAYLDTGLAAIDQLAANGVLDPAAAATEKQKLTEELWSSRAAARIEVDPGAFLAEAAEGQWDGIGSGLADAKLRATRAEATRTAEAARAAEVASSQLAGDLKKRLGDMTDMLRGQATVTDEALLDDPGLAQLAASNPDLQLALDEARAAKALRDEIPGLRGMNVAELNNLIAAERAKPISQPYQAERIKVLTATRDELLKGYATDVPGTAAKAGLPVPALPAFDPAAPQDFAQGLAARIVFADGMKARGYSQTAQPLSPDEAASLAGIIDPKAALDPKLALAEALAVGTGGRPERITAQLGATADPAFAGAVQIIATTGNRPLAAEVLRGSQKLALGTVNLPTDTNLRTVFHGVTGGVFEDSPELAAQVMAASKAIYADRAAGVNPDGVDSILPFMDDDEAQALYAEAIQRFTGATPDANGNLTIGGLQEFNDALVWLPPGVSAGTLEEMRQGIRDQLDGLGPNVTVRDALDGAREADPLRAFRAASIDGSVPAFGENAGNWWQDVQFARVGKTNFYEMFVVIDGLRIKVPRANDPTGTAFRFDLMDLIAGATE